MTYSYTLNLSGIPLRCGFRFPETYATFGDYCTGESSAPGEISVYPAEWDFWPKTGKPTDAAAENSMMTSPCSDALLDHDRCIIHAVAFSFHGRAWLIAAPPGVGKSTQIKTLQELYPGEFSVICGDRPILQRMEDGTFLVHPSPWNGKENWYGAPAAPLAGILYLKRGEYTSLCVLSAKEAILPIYRSLICSHETEQLIRQVAAFENDLLASIPVYEYINGGVPDSSRYLYETLLSKEASGNEI